ncbi:MAG: photosynthetic protein synthase I [Sandaracinus sp.]|nr:photosynthetic protein synthase I [Sandaracinus sp.]
MRGRQRPGRGAGTRAVLATLVLLAACDEEREPPPELLDVPAFELTSQTDEPFGSAQLQGKVWVANFMFTTCPTICPLLTAQMKELTETLAGTPVRFVSFSVDPANDTPEALSRYAAGYDADPSRWTFLTGDNDAIEEVVVRGLRVHVGDRDETGNILHGSHFVLVDGTGTIRGYYESTPEGLADLATDARLLTE